MWQNKWNRGSPGIATQYDAKQKHSDVIVTKKRLWKKCSDVIRNQLISNSGDYVTRLDFDEQNESLALQDLQGTIVSLVDPGVVWISLEEKYSFNWSQEV